MDNETTRGRFNACFGSADERCEFEAHVLSVGSEYLPECARTVRDGGDASDSYYDFLLSQVSR